MGRKKDSWIFHASVAIFWLLVVSGSSFCEGAKSKGSWLSWLKSSSEEQVQPTTDEATNTTASEAILDYGKSNESEELEAITSAALNNETLIESFSPLPTSNSSATELENATTTSSTEESGNLNTTETEETITTTLSTTSAPSTTSVAATSKPPISEEALATTPASTLETSTSSAPETTAPTTTPVPNSSSRTSTSLAEEYAQDLERHMNTWFAAVDFFQNNLTYNFFNKVDSVVDSIKHKTHFLLSNQTDCRSEDLWRSPHLAGPSVFKNRTECLQTLKERDELVQEFFTLVEKFKTTNFVNAEKLRASSQMYQEGFAQEMAKMENYVVPIESTPLPTCVIEATPKAETSSTTTNTTNRSPEAKKDSAEGFAKDAAARRDSASYILKRNVDILQRIVHSEDMEKDYSHVIRALKMIQPHSAERHPPLLSLTVLPALPEIARRIFNHKFVQLRAQVGSDMYVLTADDEGSIKAVKVTEAGLTDSELAHASWEFQPNTLERTALYLRHVSRSYESVCALRNEAGNVTGELRLGKAVKNSNCYWHVNIICDPMDSSEANDVEADWGELDKVNCHVDIRNFKDSNYSLGVSSAGKVNLELFWKDDHFDEISVFPPEHQ